jgi:hypothetical protein
MPPETINEVDKFFAGLPSTDKRVADVFGDTPIVEEKKDEENDPEKGATDPEDGDPENGEPVRKNRQHRRAESKKWEDRLSEKERDIIAREARIEERERARLAALETDPNVDPLLVQMYGDNTDAIRLHQQLIAKSTKDAEDRAFQRFQESAAEEKRQRQKFESEVLEGLESIEDVYDVELTSDSPRAKKTRSEFLGLIEKLSPKNADGDIIAYVDFDSAWNIYSSTRAKDTQKTETTTRAKEIAAQTMTKATTGASTPKAVTPGFDGWKKDFGVVN